jgi:hypothetical protein
MQHGPLSMDGALFDIEALSLWELDGAGQHTHDYRAVIKFSVQNAARVLH